MGMFDDNKFKSTKQDWTTPNWLFDLLDERYKFDVDLAADSSNTKCLNYFSKEQNALCEIWKGNGWLNPPYGGVKENSLKNWVKKSFFESKQENTSVTILIPARTNTNWWHEYCMNSFDIIFIKGRVKFGGAKYGLPQPLAVLHFNNVAGKNVYTLDIKNQEIK